MARGRKRTVDSGRRDTLGRIIKLATPRNDNTISAARRKALRESGNTKRTTPTSRHLYGSARRFLQASKKPIAIGAVSVLSLSMGACSSSDIQTQNVTPDYAQICVDSNTNNRLNDEDCAPNESTSTAPQAHSSHTAAILMWLAMSQGNRTVYVPGVGQKVDISAQEVRTTPPEKGKYSVKAPTDGGHMKADDFSNKKSNLISSSDSSKSHETLKSAKENAKSKSSGGFGESSGHGRSGHGGHTSGG